VPPRRPGASGAALRSARRPGTKRARACSPRGSTGRRARCPLRRTDNRPGPGLGSPAPLEGDSAIRTVRRVDPKQSQGLGALARVVGAREMRSGYAQLPAPCHTRRWHARQAPSSNSLQWEALLESPVGCAPASPSALPRLPRLPWQAAVAKLLVPGRRRGPARHGPRGIGRAQLQSRALAPDLRQSDGRTGPEQGDRVLPRDFRRRCPGAGRPGPRVPPPACGPPCAGARRTSGGSPGRCSRPRS
jgi:hypothetical protein